jgi:hypothetical protein
LSDLSVLYRDLSLSAQTAYAELLEQSRVQELQSLAGLVGSFHRRTIKGHEYAYFGYRDPIGGAQRRVYVGPADERVEALVARFREEKEPRRLAPSAQAALAHGCGGVLPKHFRIIRQLGAYGFFRAGGVLIGTHAFVAMGNMLGVAWSSGQRTLDIDFAHAGRNVSLALPASLKIDVHDALTSLELGLLPIQELSGKRGAQYRNPKDPELRVDFLTVMVRGGEPVELAELGLVLEPLKFMEFLLEGVTQAALPSREGACLTNIPEPARFAVHKLIVAGERPTSQRVKAAKDVEQVAALAEWHLRNGHATELNRAFRDALARGKGWSARLNQGLAHLLGRYPELDAGGLWRSRSQQREP